jgi:hypothetical protein
LALAAEEFGATLFGSNSLATGVLQTEQRLTPEQAQQMPGRASGGRVGKFTGGAAGGRGRLEKTEHAKRDRDHDKDDR